MMDYMIPHFTVQSSVTTECVPLLNSKNVNNDNTDKNNDNNNDNNENNGL